MNSKVETVNVKLDSFKIAAALILLLVGIVGFYVFAGGSFLLRVIGLLICTAVAAVIVLQTEQGRAAWGFLQEAQTEVRKIVWPNRQETMQTTLIVISMVIVFAIILWLLDIVLGAAVRYVIGQGG